MQFRIQISALRNQILKCARDWYVLGLRPIQSAYMALPIPQIALQQYQHCTLGGGQAIFHKLVVVVAKSRNFLPSCLISGSDLNWHAMSQVLQVHKKFRPCIVISYSWLLSHRTSEYAFMCMSGSSTLRTSDSPGYLKGTSPSIGLTSLLSNGWFWPREKAALHDNDFSLF